jgi:metal-responsive CopG/Arc/MetJ family transcriptional regulator
MSDQVTLRIPADLARALAARARATGVKRSQVVREALRAFLGAPASPAAAVHERIGRYVGAVSLGRPERERDALTERLRAHNWRE